MIGRVATHPLVKEMLTQYFSHKIYTNETTGVITMKVVPSTHPKISLPMTMQVKIRAEDITAL